jgi:hypothetical protein
MPNTTLADFGLLRVLTGMTTLGLAAVGCGGAEVKVAFDHRADSSSATGQALTVADGNTPTVFGMKLVTIYLVEDRGADMNNIGNVGRIWMNPACDPDGYKCSIAPAAGVHQVKDYFDLALPTSEVNARLNAQGSEIKPGTYHYLHMDLAGPISTDDHTSPNLQFGAGAATSQVRLTNNGYVVRLDPPMVIGGGDAVTVTLGYDVRGSYFTGDALDAFHPPAGTGLDEWYCGDQSRTPARGPCLRFSGFTPAVSRESK